MNLILHFRKSFETIHYKVIGITHFERQIKIYQSELIWHFGPAKYTLFVCLFFLIYKNTYILYKNIEAEISEIQRIDCECTGG